MSFWKRTAAPGGLLIRTRTTWWTTPMRTQLPPAVHAWPRASTTTPHGRSSTSHPGTLRRQAASTGTHPSLPPPVPAHRRLLLAVAVVGVAAAP